MPAELKTYSSLFDISFSENLIQTYTLVCVIGSGSFTFCIYQKQQLIAVEEIYFQNTKTETELIQLLNTILLEKKWLTGSFRQFILVYENTLNTLVPFPLFEENDAQTYLTFNQQIPEKHLIKLNMIKSVQSVNLFSIHDALFRIFEGNWREMKLIHFSTVLIESLANQFKYETGNNTLFVNLRNDSFDIVYFKNKKLFFYNNFTFKTKEDFVYFLLISLEQLGLNTEDTLLTLTGKIENNSENYSLLEKYVRHIRFLFPIEPLNSKILIEKEYYNRNFVLFNALLCE